MKGRNSNQTQNIILDIISVHFEINTIQCITVSRKWILLLMLVHLMLVY